MKMLKVESTFYQAVFFISLGALVASGCDKIPFLSKEKKPNPVVQEAPASAEPKNAEPIMAANTLARVGNWTLTIEDFNEKLKSLKEVIPDYNIEEFESKKLVLEELVRQQLLVEEAERRGISQEKDIAKALEEFKRTLLVRELATKLTEGITVTPEESEKYYNDNKELFSEPGEWKLREIVVPTQEEAKEILIELLKGTDFSDIAKTKSKAPSAANGGDLGTLTELPFPEMEAAISSLEVGAVSSVCKGPEGFYIVKVEDKKGGAPLQLSEVQEEIKAGLTLMKQQQEILKYLEELKQKTSVTLNESLLK